MSATEVIAEQLVLEHAILSRQYNSILAESLALTELLKNCASVSETWRRLWLICSAPATQRKAHDVKGLEAPHQARNQGREAPKGKRRSLPKRSDQAFRDREGSQGRGY